MVAGAPPLSITIRRTVHGWRVIAHRADGSEYMTAWRRLRVTADEVAARWRQA